MENKKFYIKNISEINLSNSINLNSSIIYSSSYKNILLFLTNNNLFFKGKYIDQQNQNNFIFEKISSNTNKTKLINLQQKFIKCDFTLNNIYFITQNKNEILFSNYLLNENMWNKFNFIFNIWGNGI